MNESRFCLQIKYYTEAHQLYAELCSRLQQEQQQEEDKAEEERMTEQNIEKLLGDIKALTITKDK